MHVYDEEGRARKWRDGTLTWRCAVPHPSLARDLTGTWAAALSLRVNNGTNC